MKKSWRSMFAGETGRKYKEAIEYLDDNYAFFLTHVLNLGSPKYSTSVPTACVALPEPNGDATDFEFIFNEDFLAELSVQDTAFILAHETLHIILNHLVLARSFVDYKKVSSLQKKFKGNKKLTAEEGKDLAKEKAHMQIFNIAADCCINDFLNNNGLYIEDEELSKNLMSGKRMVGHSCANSTVTEVFDELMQQIEDYIKQNTCETCGGTGQVGNDSGDSKGDSDGQEGDEKGQDGQGSHSHGDGSPCPDCNGSGHKSGGPQYKMLDSHGWIHGDIDAKDVQNMQDMWDQVKDDMPKDLKDMRDDINYDSGMKMAGSEAGNINEFAVATGVSLAWVELLKEIDPDLFKGKILGPPPKVSWHRKPRKTAAFDTILPVKRVDERIDKSSAKGSKKPSIVMALDTSGSISRQDAARFIALAQSVPNDKMHLYPCTFTTVYTKLDLDNPRYGSGGTSFSAVEDFIQKEVIPGLGHYPKAVVVITDGCATFDRTKIPAGQEDSWFWLLTDTYGYYDTCKNIGQSRSLDDFVDTKRL